MKEKFSFVNKQDKICRMVMKGKTRSEICNKFGCQLASLNRFICKLKKEGFEPPELYPVGAITYNKCNGYQNVMQKKGIDDWEYLGRVINGEFKPKNSKVKAIPAPKKQIMPNYSSKAPGGRETLYTTMNPKTVKIKQDDPSKKWVRLDAKTLVLR
jgi:hypothetical protein